MRIYRSAHFWLVFITFTLCGLLQYVEQIGIGHSPSLHFGLTRHALDRILFLIPVIYAGFAFGMFAGIVTCASALIVMLPRAIAISPAPEDAILETVAVTAVGALACTGLWKLAKDKERLRTALTKLESAYAENTRLYEKERLTAGKLAASERRYRELFENANDAIWVCDLAGNVLMTNSATERLTGYNANEFQRMTANDFLARESLSEYDGVRVRLAEKIPVQQPYEAHMIRNDGTEAVLMLATSLITEDGKPVGFQHIARDVTEERRMQNKLQYYLTQITRAQEDERMRIARELHDDTVQVLYAMSREVDSFLKRNQSLAAEDIVWLRRLRQQLNDASDGTRRSSQALRPPMLDDLGLVPSIRWLVREMRQIAQIEIGFRVSGIERRLAPEAELTLFRATQEALRNVWKHAHAMKSDVAIAFNENSICISVIDDGQGFAATETTDHLLHRGKLGLAGIEERMRLLGGRLRVLSEPGIGTVLIVEAPL